MHGHLNATFLFFSSAGEVSGILFFPSINVPILYKVKIKTNNSVRLSRGFIAPRPLYTGPLCPTLE
jgi:hypothetical protein